MALHKKVEPLMALKPDMAIIRGRARPDSLLEDEHNAGVPHRLLLRPMELGSDHGERLTIKDLC